MKKGFAGTEFLADELVLTVGQVKNGVQQKGEQVEQYEDGGQVLLAMAIVVLQMIAVVLEHVVVLVFNLPASSARGNDGKQRLLREGVAGGEGVLVDALTDIFPMDGHLTPVDMQGVQAVTQRELISIAAMPDFGIACSPATQGVLGQAIDPAEQIHLFVERQVGVRFAGHDEVHFMLEQHLTEGLFTVKIIGQNREPREA